MNVSPPRVLAARVLQQRETAHEYTEDLLARESAGHALSPADRGLFQELTYGVVRHQAALDWLIARKTANRTQKAGLQILLRLGLYQIFWLDRIPDHAAVHESVALARQLGFGPQSGFVNAVLRSYLRERTATEQLLQELRQGDPALAWSHPKWLFERWEARWGREQAIRLMEWNNQPALTFARVNTLRTSAEKLCALWQTEGVSFEPFTNGWTPENLVFRLTQHPAFLDLPSFQRGFFYVQDPSTLLAVQELAPQPGERILDLCAAPGGKATFIAQLLSNKGVVAARDLHPERLRLVRENCSRLGVTCVEAGLTSEAPASTHEQLFDRALVDAPCSNTGVMRRRVDLRWRIRPEELARLQRDQLQLLQTAAAQLSPGGRLVYSTCSLEPEENQEVIRRFCAANPAFHLEAERQLVPFVDQVDGAYVAVLRRA